MSEPDPISIRPLGGSRVSSPSPGQGDGRSYENLEHGPAANLFRFGLRGPRRAVDDLIVTLQGSDRERSLMRMLHSEQLVRLGDGRGATALLQPTLSIDDLAALKDTAKVHVGEARSRDEYLTGVLVYHLALAAGVVHYGQLRSSMPPREIRDAMLDLATAMPDPWADFLARGAMKLDPSGGAEV